MRKKPSLFGYHPHFQENKKHKHIFFSLRFEEVEEDFDEIKAVLDPEDSTPADGWESANGRWIRWDLLGFGDPQRTLGRLENVKGEDFVNGKFGSF